MKVMARWPLERIVDTLEERFLKRMMVLRYIWTLNAFQLFSDSWSLVYSNNWEMFYRYMCIHVCFYNVLLSCPLAQSEEERVRDQKEREELEQHLKDRDTARTRKVCLNLILVYFSCFVL
jgi:hypothetical protein